MSKESITFDHVPRSTFFWILGTLITIQTVVLGIVGNSIESKITNVNERVTEVRDQLSIRIDDNEEDINAVQSDIRAILIGIEQLKRAEGISD